MKVLTSLASASALCIAAPSCKCGTGHADAAPEHAVASFQRENVLEEPDPAPLAMLLDPDDEAFEEALDDEADAEGSLVEEGSDQGLDGQEFTIKGTVRRVEAAEGVLVVNQLLSDGARHDVRFLTDSSTRVGWSKASMPVELADLPVGATVYVTYRVVLQGGMRRNHALRIILPGGMEDVAKMILDEPELPTD